MRTNKGRHLNMDALVAQNEMKKAIGNTNTNVRGDQLDDTGNVVRSAEEIAREQHMRTPVQQEYASIDADIGFSPEATPPPIRVEPKPEPIQQEVAPVQEEVVQQEVKPAAKPKTKSSSTKAKSTSKASSATGGFVENEDGDFVPADTK